MWICDINNQLRGRRVCMLSRWLLLTVVFSLLFSHSVCPILSHPMDCSTPLFPVLHHLPKIAQTHVHWAADAIQPSHPLSALLLLPSIFPSIKDFSNESALHIRWPKYWSFSFSISPSNEYWGLISFRIDWFDLLAVQGTIKSSPAPLFKSINSSLLSLLYGLTSIHEYYGKNIASNIQNLLARWHLCFLICCIGWS